MIQFKRTPDGEYISKLSNLSSELFDLMAATVNLLESQDMSTTSLLDKTLLEDNSAQEILSAIISEREELEGRDILDAPMRFRTDESTGGIVCFDL